MVSAPCCDADDRVFSEAARCPILVSGLFSDRPEM
jgi:hypothetical protein